MVCEKQLAHVENMMSEDLQMMTSGSVFLQRVMYSCEIDVVLHEKGSILAL